MLGATPVNERVGHGCDRITGGGATAGIDFGLTLASKLRSHEDALPAESSDLDGLAQEGRASSGYPTSDLPATEENLPS